MLNPSDIYTYLGGNTLKGCWTTNVSKHDASGFYNWEADNLPLFDLEERSDFLWERLGHPTSSVNGFAFVVSANATSACNRNIFTSLSACLQKLPEVINAPYFIEVMSYGQLGELNLSNKTFGPRGSIEIVNRNFTTAASYYPGLENTVAFQRSDNTYGLASSIGFEDLTIAGLHNLGFLVDGVIDNYLLNKSLTLGTYCPSTTGYDPRITNNVTLFAKNTTSYFDGRLNAALATNNPTAPFATNNDVIVSFTPYEINARSEDLINTYDASCINEVTNSEVVWKPQNSSPVANLTYFNRLSSIKVYNCNGPIYLRNFTVDANGASGVNEYGIDIRGSTVTLENCSVSRARKAGLHALNSKVNLERGFVAYRNYAFEGTSRVGEPWRNKLNSKKVYDPDTLGTGLLAINSDIEIINSYNRDLSSARSASGSYDPTTYLLYLIVLGGGALNFIPEPDMFFCFSRNNIGIRLVNSNLKGGKTELGSISLGLGASHLYSELNTDWGILSEGSRISHSGKIFLHGNYKGLESKTSLIDFDSIVAKYNQKEAILAKNSQIKYNKDLYKIANSVIEASGVNQIALINNGTHLRLVNSTLEPFAVSSAPSIFDRFIASGSFGVTQDSSLREDILPGVIVEEGSKLHIIHAGILTPDALLDSSKATYGAGISVTDNSELILQGSKSYVNKILGPTTFALQNKKSGIAANNNSTIKIQGPTVIARFGVDLLADNGSNIQITPHRTSEGTLDVSGFNLSDKENHTSVELHSTRACIVIDNGSILNVEDLGDYRVNWARGSYGTTMLASALDFNTQAGSIDSSIYTSGGSLQFYPNPNESTSIAVLNPTSVGTLYSVTDMTVNANGYNYLLEDAIGSPLNSSDFSSVTLGGMCVRQLNGSIAKLKNVHFPCGWWNPSAIIYDVSGADSTVLCNRLFIWNVADDSYIDASYLSVSGLHPADASYFGPSGVWGSASSAPTSTPDTSSVSILDYYGRSTNHPYSRSTASNQGPFRLYFSVDPAINWAVNTSLEWSGAISQVYSQGYQFSGNLIFPGNVSSFYTSILRKNGNNLEASGFYYASSIAATPNLIKAKLDDSAANTFANSKHNTVGKSGLAKQVVIYFPYTNTYGGDSANSAAKQYGRGVKSINNFDLDKDN